MDPISDMLTRITNAQAVGHVQVVVPFSNVKLHIATILFEAGYLTGVERVKRTVQKAERDYLELGLKYEDGVGIISGVRLISKPSRHIYVKAHALRPVRSGYGIAVVSTSQGIMNSRAAKKAGLGGEMLFEIW